MTFSVHYKGVDYEVSGTFTKGSPATWGYDGGCPEEPASFELHTITPEPDFDVDLDEEFMVLLDERAAEEASDREEAHYWEDR